MPTIELFLIKSIITSGVLLACYWLFLRNNHFHVYNRFYLLATLVISIVIPFIHIDWHIIHTSQNIVPIKLLNVINSNEREKEIFIKQTTSFNLYNIILFVYAIISCSFLAILIYRINKILKLKRSAESINMNGFVLIKTTYREAPFSFFKMLFWNKDVALNSEVGKLILTHELIHIKQHHTLDKLFMQLVLVLLWINPFYWLLQKELSIVHEFIADEAAIENADTESFAMMLLSTPYVNIYPDIAHQFFYSPIKRRLSMLSKMKKTNYSSLRKILVLPLLALIVFLFSFSKKDIYKADKKIILVLDAGHGGQDNGAINKDGDYEKDLTLKITKRLATLAPDYNIDPVQTRPDDNYIALNNRTAIANKASADVFMSIHINSPGMDSGYEMIVDDRNTSYMGSIALSSAIAQKLNTIAITPKITKKHLVVLNNSKMPSVLLECGNIENVKESLLKTDAQLDLFCRNVLKGVVDYENSLQK